MNFIVCEMCCNVFFSKKYSVTLCDECQKDFWRVYGRTKALIKDSPREKVIRHDKVAEMKKNTALSMLMRKSIGGLVKEE